MSKISYSEKLKDPRWQKLRLKAMEAADFCCEVCCDSAKTLNVHHKEYFKGYEPWEYEVKQLAVLCETCHEFEHDSIDVLRFVCSYVEMDGPIGRKDAAFVLAGFIGMDYQGLITFSGVQDNEHHKNLYKDGVRSQRYLQKKTIREMLEETLNRTTK